MRKIILAITGASGAPIGIRLLEAILQTEDIEISLVMSDNARLTCRFETGVNFGGTREETLAALAANFKTDGRVHLYDLNDMAAKISSGSHPTAVMIIAPCSMSTLGAIASGITLNLIHRAASVMLKERRPLILVPRESPLSVIHLRNMLAVSRAGAHIVPATLAFYTRPKSIQEMIDFTCARVLDLAGIEHGLSKRWEGGTDAREIHTRIQGYLG